MVPNYPDLAAGLALSSILTSGTSGVVNVWNPHVVDRPAAVLRGHTEPLVKVMLSPSNMQCVSVTNNETIKVRMQEYHMTPYGRQKYGLV